MRAFGHVVSMPRKEHAGERRKLLCEICGERLEIERESGEYRCSVCDMPEE